MLDGGVRHNLEASSSTAYTTTLGSARAGLGRDGNSPDAGPCPA